MNTPFKVMEISIVMVHGCRKTKKKAFWQSKESDVLPHSYICKGKLETHVKAIHVMRIKT